jgi:hypothetical protein
LLCVRCSCFFLVFFVLLFCFLFSFFCSYPFFLFLLSF